MTANNNELDKFLKQLRRLTSYLQKTVEKIKSFGPNHYKFRRIKLEHFLSTLKLFDLLVNIPEIVVLNIRPIINTNATMV